MSDPILIRVEIQALTEEGHEAQKIESVELQKHHWQFVPGMLNVAHAMYLNESLKSPGCIEIGLSSGTEVEVKGSLDEIMLKINRAYSEYNHRLLIGRSQ